MILITTAGKVGAEAARLLAQQGAPVRVLIRDPAKATALAEAGVDVVEGDLAVPATIDAAMRGVSAVVLVSPAIPVEELNVVDGAVRAGVAHVVKITSKASADSPIARRRDQTEIEQGLIASGLGYTLLRNNAYMQNFLMLAPAIARTSDFGSSTGDGRVGMVDTRDVAAVAAAIAASPDPHAGKTYWLTGPERLSYAAAAAVLSDVLGRPITFHPLTFDEQWRAMVAAGVPETIARMNAQALSLFAEGDSDWVTDDVPSLLGQPARTFEQFVADFAASFFVTLTYLRQRVQPDAPEGRDSQAAGEGADPPPTSRGVSDARRHPRQAVERTGTRERDPPRGQSGLSYQAGTVSPPAPAVAPPGPALGPGG